MHLPDGFLEPEVWGTMSAVSAGTVALASHRAARVLPPERQPVVGLAGAFVFAAQAVNFPVLPGVSGHLVGGLLACILVGPAAAVVVMTVVLLIQALLFADGGLTALGANVFNMGIAGTLGGYAVYVGLRQIGPSRAWMLISTFAAAWVSVMVAAFTASVELILSGTVGPVVLWPMLSVHAVIGIGEALITVAALQLVLSSRPDVLGEAPAEQAVPLRKWLAGGVAICGLIALGLAPFASSAPDGLEALAERLDFAGKGVDSAVAGSPLADYGIRGLGNTSLSTATSVFVGTLVVLGILLLVGRAIGRSQIDRD